MWKVEIKFVNSNPNPNHSYIPLHFSNLEEKKEDIIKIMPVNKTLRDNKNIY